MSTREIIASSLTTFDVPPDGHCVRLHLQDDAAQPAILVLPPSCLNQLLMNLPAMVQMVLQRQHQDDSVRLIHPLQGFTLERGELNDSGIEQFILTLHTLGGFTVSFSASIEDLTSMANAVSEELPLPRDARTSPRLC